MRKRERTLDLVSEMCGENVFPDIVIATQHSARRDLPVETLSYYYVRNKTKITGRRQQKEEKVQICEKFYPSCSAYCNTNKDGTPIWGKRHVEGPGVWVSCAFVDHHDLVYIL